VAQARLNNGAVPNPNGKKGGEAHQKTIDKEEQRLKDEGFNKTERGSSGQNT